MPHVSPLRIAAQVKRSDQEVVSRRGRRNTLQDDNVIQFSQPEVGPKFPFFPIDPLEHGSVAGVPDDRATPQEVHGALGVEQSFANAVLISRNEMPEGLLESFGGDPIIPLDRQSIQPWVSIPEIAAEDRVQMGDYGGADRESCG
jgi:hypothetical protein